MAVAGPAINHGEGQNRCHRAIKWVTGRVGELHDRTEAARGERTARTKRSGPTRSPGAWLRHCTRPHCLDWPPTRLRYGKRGTKRDQATGLPACRAANELRPLATARSCRFDWPAWGTHEYLGRGAFGPPAADRGKRSGDVDPQELFGAAWWLTPLRDTGAARATGATPCVPRVTIQEAYQSFCGEFFSLDFRGHRVVRRHIASRGLATANL